jgi:exodeoxyribonuclease-3
MQETKCYDDRFPAMPFLAAGYEVVHCGFSQWNGVAIASRVNLDDVQVGFDGQPTWSDNDTVEAKAEARALGPTCNGVRGWSLYVPNGRFVGSPHYHCKLEWLAALRDAAYKWLTDDPSAQFALGGDWNIAPTDEDVWSVEFYKDSTRVTPKERAAFNATAEA